jgi:hypothetical protein
VARPGEAALGTRQVPLAPTGTLRRGRERYAGRRAQLTHEASDDRPHLSRSHRVHLGPARSQSAVKSDTAGLSGLRGSRAWVGDLRRIGAACGIRWAVTGMSTVSLPVPVWPMVMSPPGKSGRPPPLLLTAGKEATTKSSALLKVITAGHGGKGSLIVPFATPFDHSMGAEMPGTKVIGPVPEARSASPAARHRPRRRAPADRPPAGTLWAGPRRRSRRTSFAGSGAVRSPAGPPGGIA